MSLWGSADYANNAPKYKILPDSTANGSTLFGTRVVGLDDGEVQSSSRANGPGWTLVTYGKGGVTGLAIANAGTGYTNGDFVNISGGTTNATFTVGTNGSGVITSVTGTSNGSGFSNVSSLTVAVKVANGSANSAGTDGAFTVTLGGRAGRIQTETLVALSSMSANGSTLA